MDLSVEFTMDDCEIIESILDEIIDFIAENIPDENQTVEDTIPIYSIDQTSTYDSYSDSNPDPDSDPELDPEPDPDSNPYPYPYQYPYQYQYQYQYQYPDSNLEPDPDSNPEPDSNLEPDPDSNPEPDPNPDPDSDPDPDPFPNPEPDPNPDPDPDPDPVPDSNPVPDSDSVSESDGSSTNTVSNENNDEDEEKIYPLFDEATIQFAAEQASLYKDLSEKAAAAVASQCKYRLRELIHGAGQFMRHSFRKKLTTKDIFRAMQEADCDVIFGHNNPALNDIQNYYRSIPTAYAFVENKFKIDLKQETYRYLMRPEFQFSNFQQQHDCRFDIGWFSRTIGPTTCDEMNFSIKSKIIDEYFRKLIDTLTRRNPELKDCEQERCLQIFLNDISTNRSLKPLLCPLFYFIRNTLRKWESASRRPTTIDVIVFNQTRLKLTKRFLSVLRAIIQNDTFVDFSLNSKVLLDLSETILSLCFHQFEDLTMDSYAELYEEILNIRSYASGLFAQILFKFCLPFADTKVRLIELFCSKIKARQPVERKDQLQASTVDYAMLSIFRHLGFDVCLRYLIPLLLDDQSFLNVYLENFANETKTVSKEDSISRQIDILIAGQISMIGRLVIKGLDLLILEKPADIVLIDSSNHIYSYFYHWFGDSLFCSLYPVLESPKLAKILLHSRKFSTKTSEIGKPETEVDNSDRENFEKSLNKLPKKKATKLLESMLSTDTTRMAKNESLSMFTDSLLDSSHNQYERTFLYQQDFDEESKSSSTTALAKNLIIFEGKRLMSKEAKDLSFRKKIRRHHSSHMSYLLSEWYHLSVNHRSMEPRPLACFRKNKSTKLVPQSWFRFNHDRKTPYPSVNCSLYNHL